MSVVVRKNLDLFFQDLNLKIELFEFFEDFFVLKIFISALFSLFLNGCIRKAEIRQVFNFVAVTICCYVFFAKRSWELCFWIFSVSFRCLYLRKNQEKQLVCHGKRMWIFVLSDCGCRRKLFPSGLFLRKDPEIRPLFAFRRYLWIWSLLIGT